VEVGGTVVVVVGIVGVVGAGSVVVGGRRIVVVVDGVVGVVGTGIGVGPREGIVVEVVGLGDCEDWSEELPGAVDDFCWQAQSNIKASTQASRIS
jgi:hypothetical protein